MSAKKNLLGELLAANRRARGLLQQEIADRVGMTRSLYSQLETGTRKEPPTPQQARALSVLLGIPMLSMVNAMGYPIECPGFETEEEVSVIEAYRRLTPDQQRVIRAGMGLVSPTALAIPEGAVLRRSLPGLPGRRARRESGA